MNKLGKLYEGKAKMVFETSEPGLVVIEYKDDATAMDGRKRGTIVGKGKVNNLMSAVLFKRLERAGVKTHYVETLSDTSMLVRRLEMVPLEVVVRNTVAGSLAKRLGLPEGLDLEKPVFELYYKDDALGDPLVNDSHIELLRAASPEIVAEMRAMASKVNDVLKAALLSIGLILVDFKLEFGLADGVLYLGDEISPDTCRLWDVETRDKLDKDRFRRDMGGVEDAYQEVLARLSGGGLS